MVMTPMIRKGMTNFAVLRGLWWHTAKAMEAMLLAVGKPSPREAESDMTRATALGFIPPASATLTPMGVKASMTAVLLRKVVSSTVTRLNMKDT